MTVIKFLQLPFDKTPFWLSMGTVEQSRTDRFVRRNNGVTATEKQ